MKTNPLISGFFIVGFLVGATTILALVKSRTLKISADARPPGIELESDLASALIKMTKGESKNIRVTVTNIGLIKLDEVKVSAAYPRTGNSEITPTGHDVGELEVGGGWEGTFTVKCRTDIFKGVDDYTIEAFGLTVEPYPKKVSDKLIFSVDCHGPEEEAAQDEANHD